jgi:FKBP-type peptidyl-prolyl cis-trans isomerase
MPRACEAWHEAPSRPVQVGGIRRITSPPELAFGAKGKPPRIPGGATVAFDVQLLSVKRAGSNPISSQGKGSTMF